MSSKGGVFRSRAHQFFAAHVRHHHVGQNQIGPEFERLLETLVAVIRRDHPVFRADGFHQKRVHVGVVFHHQN